jgi:hypothetical protein
MNKSQLTSGKYRRSASEQRTPRLKIGSEFRKSSFSESGNCVEVGREHNGTVMLRDTKDASRQTLRFSKSEWSAFLHGVKNNEFDVE